MKAWWCFFVCVLLALSGCATKKARFITAPPAKQTINWTWDYDLPMPVKDTTFVIVHTFDLKVPMTYLTNLDQPPVNLDASKSQEFFAMYASNRVTGKVWWDSIK